MKKNLLLVTLVTQTISAQIMSYDKRFASNGKSSTVAETSNSYSSPILQYSDEDLYFINEKEASKKLIFPLDIYSPFMSE